MKKILSVVLCIFTLAACSNSKEISPVLGGISFNAELTYYNESYKGECTLSAENVLTCRITEPEILSGYTVTLSPEGAKAEYLGITYTPTESNMPFSGVLGEFYSTLTEIIGSEAKAEKKDGVYAVSGGKDAAAYTLYVSESGLPLSIELPDERFTVYFYNTTLL